MGGCIDDRGFAAYVDGDLTADEVEAIDRHIDGCQGCRAHLSALVSAPIARSFVAAAETARAAGAETPDLARTAPAGDTSADRAAATGASSSSPGRSLGRYVIEATIGRGGMGEVLRAHDPVLDRKVAIKLLHADLVRGASTTGEWRRRLRAEGQAMARLRHPNIVAVHDAGGFGDQLFVAMELVDGTSLTEWLRGGRRGWREILDTCVAAGRGLAAAHAAGVVHGDVKPDNVLVDRDGRALVGDFGLARRLPAAERTGAAGSGDPGPASEAGSPDGAWAGTPVYMAPELLEGAPADASSDQFAFCVTLYEALLGRRPWRSRTFAALCEEVRAARVERPARPRIPTWLWRVIARGLSPERARRFPSMDALLAAIDRRRSRRRWIAGAAAAGAAAAAIGAWQIRPATALEPCKAPVERATAVWGGPVRAAACARLQAVLGAGAGGCDALVAPLDRHRADWISAHVAVCRATFVERVQSDELLDHRMRCLDRALGRLESLARGLHDVDREAAFEARSAALSLEDPAACRRVEREPRFAPPDPARAADVAAAEARLAERQADFDLGRYRAGATALARDMPAIRALEHPPLTTRASVLLADLQGKVGDPAAAEQSLNEAAAAAAASGDDATLAEVWTSLLFVVSGALEQPERGRDLARMAEAAVLRAGGPPLLRAQLAVNRGVLHAEKGELEESERHFAAGVQLFREALGPRHLRVGLALMSWCAYADNRSRARRGEQQCREAVDILGAAAGPDHPIVAYARFNLGNLLGEQDRTREARDEYLAGLVSLERVHGRDSPVLVKGLLNLANVSRELGELGQAAGYLDRAVALVGSDGHDPRAIDGAVALADLLVADDRMEEGIAAARRALALARRAVGETHPDTGKALRTLAAALHRANRLDEAREVSRAAADVYERSLGPRHPRTGRAAFLHGQILQELERLDEARGWLERALAVFEQTDNPDDPWLAQTCTLLAHTLLELGEHARALPLAERGLAIQERKQAPAMFRADARFVVGAALWGARQRDRARQEVRRARDEMRAAGPAAAPYLPKFDRWLALHR